MTHWSWGRRTETCRRQAKIGPRRRSGPIFRRDIQRSGTTQRQVDPACDKLWETRFGRTAGRLYSRGRSAVHDLAADTGGPRLARRKRADGLASHRRRLCRHPPTFHRGRLYFGCTDGWVYCLRAADGAGSVAIPCCAGRSSDRRLRPLGVRLARPWKRPRPQRPGLRGGRPVFFPGRRESLPGFSTPQVGDWLRRSVLPVPRTCRLARGGWGPRRRAASPTSWSVISRRTPSSCTAPAICPAAGRAERRKEAARRTESAARPGRTERRQLVQPHAVVHGKQALWRLSGLRRRAGVRSPRQDRSQRGRRVLRPGTEGLRTVRRAAEPDR